MNESKTQVPVNRRKAGRPGITKDGVAQAVKELQLEGRKATVQNILYHLGGKGSRKTIMNRLEDLGLRSRKSLR